MLSTPFLVFGGDNYVKLFLSILKLPHIDTHILNGIRLT